MFLLCQCGFYYLQLYFLVYFKWFITTITERENNEVLSKIS